MTSGRNLSHRVPVNLNIQVIHMENWFTNKLSLLDGILINRSPKFV
jgi:DNA integrity scanning protein DisA with diadenylate cyclase activity